MAEVFNDSKVKPIAFYLPQFHEIPENNKFYGEGFTEWTNTKKAKPLFPGHYQPRIPFGQNYYCLLDEGIMESQAKLAKEYGIFGFCYYHYWFKDGKKLLEKPIELMLSNDKVDIPFCLCWANENWSKKWDGGNHEIIVEQDYGSEDDWDMHIKYLIPFFKDRRYITLNGKPLFVLYRPELIPNLKQMMKYWRNKICENGFSGIIFAIQHPSWYFMTGYNPDLFDYQIKFEPFFSLNYQEKNIDKIRIKQKIYSLSRCLFLDKFVDIVIEQYKKRKEKIDINDLKKTNYDELWSTVLKTPITPKTIEGAFVDWDNTARKKNGMVCLGATPEKFEKNMKSLGERVKKEASNPIIFINAWNEWAEAAYLEPDEKYGFEYLQALKNAIS